MTSVSSVYRGLICRGFSIFNAADALLPEVTVVVELALVVVVVVAILFAVVHLRRVVVRRATFPAARIAVRRRRPGLAFS